MAIYDFVVSITGDGDTPEEAWQDAVAGLYIEPGEMPEGYCERIGE